MLDRSSIVPLIQSQFPLLYQEEGPMMVSLLEAYYEWLEGRIDRQIVANRDIDAAASLFLEHFRQTYLPDIDFTPTTDKQLLVKKALDVYRAKGTPRAFDLLIRLMYGVGAEVYFPGDDILRTSDGRWTEPRFIEVTRSSVSPLLVGTVIKGADSKATAYVVSYVKRYANNDLVDVLNISNITGQFKTGELIYNSVPKLNGPLIVGSANKLTVVDGKQGFVKGQEILFTGGRGIDGLLRVVSVSKTGTIKSALIVDSGVGFINQSTVYGRINGYAVCQFTVTNGPIGKGKPYYDGTYGFTSANKFLQDSEYYQQYSYDVRTSIPFDKYKNTLINVLHVAGKKAFGSLLIQSRPTAVSLSKQTEVSMAESQIPSLTLNFNTTETLDARITFSRATSATRFNSAGILETIAVNGPRFNYNPATLVSQGLLIEESRTNVLAQSNQLDTAPWAGLGGTVTTLAAVTSPDGTANAIGFQAGTTLAAYGRSQPYTYAAGVHTLSVFVKKGTANNFVLDFNGGGTEGANFNLTSGTVAFADTGVTGSITAINNGWYRCSITKTLAGGAGAPQWYFTNSTTANVRSFTPAGTETIYLFGAQLEAGINASTYIATTTAAVTRSADNASINGTTFSYWYNLLQGTFVVEFNRFSPVNGNLGYAIAAADGTDYLSISENAGTRVTVFDAGANQFDSLLTNMTANTFARVAIGYKLNDFAASMNGGAVVTDTIGTVHNATTLAIGHLSGNSFLNGHVKSITYYRQRKTNAEIVGYSTP